MKIIKNENGYITSVFVLLMLIPILLLLIITIEEYEHDVNNTVDNLESKKIQRTTEDFENELILLTKETLHNVTSEVIISNKVLSNSREYIKEQLQNKINKKQEYYIKKDIILNCSIKKIKSSNDPFKIEITYSLFATSNKTSAKISKEVIKLIEITSNEYPIYDPLPTLKTGATFKDGNVYYSRKLSDNIILDNNTSYLNVIQSVTIKKCPYDDYKQHGNNNKTILNCIENHYYHNSHDGMCLLCRLENKTNCNDYGFETFILPTKIMDKAPTSIDHVLLNNIPTQYMGNNIIIDNMTSIYLDNGHKAKYGL